MRPCFTWHTAWSLSITAAVPDVSAACVKGRDGGGGGEDGRGRVGCDGTSTNIAGGARDEAGGED